MTICHGIPWYRNGADDHCPFIIEGWWLFFYPLSYLTLTLNQRYLALKEEVKEAEKIRKSVYSILRQEQREQPPHRKQGMER